MINVYRLDLDVDHFQFLLFEDDNVSDKYRFHGTSYKKGWKPPAVYVYKPKLKVPDFWTLSPHPGFAVSRELYSSLAPLFDRAGEMLPLNLPGRDLLYFNVTNVINCLDRKLADYSPNINRVKEYAFIAERINQPIFQIPETLIVLVAEGIMGPEDEFKAVVEARKLKGLRFVKVWSGDSPSRTKTSVAPAKVAPKKPQAKSKAAPKPKAEPGYPVEVDGTPIGRFRLPTPDWTVRDGIRHLIAEPGWDDDQERTALCWVESNGEEIEVMTWLPATTQERAEANRLYAAILQHFSPTPKRKAKATAKPKSKLKPKPKPKVKVKSKRKS